MIQRYALQKELHESRRDLKAIESMFTDLTTEATNHSHVESEIIVEQVKKSLP